ncbi:MAG: alpha/beta hydrolase [Promethearchaeota archaeon]|nr:MAG: alpha/beta hydrolase [Candidatus Lokiarchaeota archaeon]
MEDNEKYTKKIKLEDGRTLGYAEMGNPNGKPIFYFNGFPGSRLEAKLGEDQFEKTPVRVIAVDRPGIGLSDPKPKRAFLDWPDDVIELADSLDIDKFAVLGISGGGPYSMACAYKIPLTRLVAAVTNGGMGPLEAGTEGMKKSNRALFNLAKKVPWLLRFLMWFSFSRKCKSVDDVQKLMLKNVDDFPEADQKLFKDPKFGRLMAEETYEAYRQGNKWVAYEATLYSNPWNFNLEDIDPTTKVFIFHGERDDQVPIGMARYMHKHIPNSELIVLPGETHFGAALKHINQMIEKILPLF